MPPKKTARASAKCSASTTPVKQSAKHSKTVLQYPQIVSPKASPETTPNRTTKAREKSSSPILISSSIKQNGKDWAVSKRVQMALPSVPKPNPALKGSHLRGSMSKVSESSNRESHSPFSPEMMAQMYPRIRKVVIPTVMEFVSEPSLETETGEEPRESSQRQYGSLEDELDYEEEWWNDDSRVERQPTQPTKANVTVPPEAVVGSARQVMSRRDAGKMVRDKLGRIPPESDPRKRKITGEGTFVEADPTHSSSRFTQKRLRTNSNLSTVPAWLLAPFQINSEWRAVRTIFEHYIPQLVFLEGCGISDEAEAYEAYIGGDESPLRYKNDKNMLLGADGPFGILVDFVNQAMAVVPKKQQKIYEKISTRKGLIEAVASIAKSRLFVDPAKIGVRTAPYPPQAGKVFQHLNASPGGRVIVKAFMIPLICDEIVEKYHAQVFAKPSPHDLAAQGGKLFKELALGYLLGLHASELSIDELVVEQGAASILRAWEDAVAWTANLADGPGKAEIWEEIFRSCTGHLPSYQDLDGSLYTEVFERRNFLGPASDDRQNDKALKELWKDVQRARQVCGADQGLWDPKAPRIFRIPTVMRRNLIVMATSSLDGEEAMLAEEEEMAIAAEAWALFPDSLPRMPPTTPGNTDSKVAAEERKPSRKVGNGWLAWLMG